jgi:hypothetical protein
MTPATRDDRTSGTGALVSAAAQLWIASEISRANVMKLGHLILHTTLPTLQAKSRSATGRYCTVPRQEDRIHFDPPRQFLELV